MRGIVVALVASMLVLVSAVPTGAVDLPLVGETNAVVYTGVHAWLWDWADHPLRQDGESWDVAVVWGYAACQNWGCAYAFEAQAIQGQVHCEGISGGVSTGIIYHALIATVPCETGWFSASLQAAPFCFGSAAGKGSVLGFSLGGRGAGEGVCGAI